MVVVVVVVAVVDEEAVVVVVVFFVVVVIVLVAMHTVRSIRCVNVCVCGLLGYLCVYGCV